MPARPLLHVDAEKKDDEALRAEARAHLADAPSLQLVAELLAKLRAADLPFWSPQVLRERWSAAERMRWYRQRPDLRQAITTKLTGLAPKAARKKMPDFQAALVDSVIDEGDIPVRSFEESFEPADLSVYGSAAAFWYAMRELFPWQDDAPPHQEVVAWLLKALLADTSSIPGLGRVPILTAWDLRTAIDGRVWHTRIPLEVRVAIDDARLAQERARPGVPFHAQDDLAIAVPDILAASVPLRDFAGVLDAAERAMGFEREAPRPKGPPDLKPPADARPSEVRARESMPPPGPGTPPQASQAPPPPPAPQPAAPATVPPPESSTTAVSLKEMARAASRPPSGAVVAVEPAPAAPAPAVASASPAPAAPPGPAPVPPATVAFVPAEVRRPTPGVPTLEDELERTNPWVVPSAEELASAAAEEPPSFDPESAIPGRRRAR